MELKPGLRLNSKTSIAQVITLKAPGGALDLRCGGVAMTDAASDVATVAMVDGFDGELASGKRYGNEDGSLLLLVTKPGRGVLTIGDVPLELKDARALPSSD